MVPLFPKHARSFLIVFHHQYFYPLCGSCFLCSQTIQKLPLSSPSVLLTLEREEPQCGRLRPSLSVSLTRFCCQCCTPRAKEPGFVFTSSLFCCCAPIRKAQQSCTHPWPLHAPIHREKLIAGIFLTRNVTIK